MRIERRGQVALAERGDDHDHEAIFVFGPRGDLKRGLVGHVFNGYDDTHVKDELKPVIARFRDGETQDARCTLDGPKLDADEVRALERAGGLVG